MDKNRKNNTLKFLIGIAVSNFLCKNEGITTPGGVVIVVDNKQEVKIAKKMIESSGIAVIVEQLDDVDNICNFEIAVYEHKKTDTEDMVLSFLDNEEFTPVFLVIGIVPEYLENVGYIFKIKEEVTEYDIWLCKNFFEWIINHIELIREEIRRSKNSRYALADVDEHEIAYKAGISVSAVWKSFFLSRGYAEDEVNEWQEDFLVWLIRSLNDKERFTGMYQITDAFCSLFFKYLDENDCYFLEVDSFDEDVYGAMKEDKVILFDEESYWIPDSLLTKICKPLTVAVSYKQIKAELAEEGTLLCNDGKKTNYTVKKLFTVGPDKKIVRPRFIRIVKDTIVDENGLTAEQYAGLKAGVM